MSADDGRLTLTAQLVDEATTPLLRLRRTVNDAVDAIGQAGQRTRSTLMSAGTGVANAFATVGAGVGAVGRGVGNVLAGIGRGIADVAVNATKAAGLVAGALVTTGIIQAQNVLQKGFERVIAIQDATAQSAVLMGGDYGKAADFINQIKEVVTGTPFALPDFAKYGQTLLSYGADAEKIPNILRAVGEATAGAGAMASEKAGQVSQAMSKMLATGKVQLGDVWTIADAGVPALQILANGFNTTSADMQDMISKGAVPAKKAIDVLTTGIMEGTNGAAGATQAYAGSMAALRGTIAGSLSVLDATKAKLGETLIAPFQKQLPDAINAFGSVVKSVGAVVAPIMQKFADTGILQKITDELTKLANAMTVGGGDGSIVAKLKEMMPFLVPILAGVAAMSSGLLGAIPVIGQFLPTINPILAVVTALVLMSPQLRGALSDAFNSIMAALKPLEPLFKQVMDLIVLIGTQLATALVPIIGQLAAILGPVLSVILKVVIDSFNILSPYIMQVVNALLPLIPLIGDMAAILISSLAPIIPIVVVFIANLAGMLVGPLVGAVKSLLPPLTGLVNMLIGMLAPILPVLFGAFSQVLGILIPIIPIVVQVAGVVLELATQFISMLLPPLMELIPLFVQLALVLATAVMDILKAIMPPLFQLLNALMPLIPPIMQIISLLVKLAIEVITPLLPLITEVARVIAMVLTKALEAAIPFVTGLIGEFAKLVSWLTEKVQPILSVIGGMFKSIGGFVADVVRAVGDFFGGAFGWIADFFKKIANGGSGGGVVGGASGGGVLHAANGAVIGGYSPGVDSVPAMLSPGEAVLVPELTRHLGAANIMAANREFSGGRPGLNGSPAPNPFARSGGGGASVQITFAPGSITVTSTDGKFDMSSFRAALEEVLNDSAKRAY